MASEVSGAGNIPRPEPRTWAARLDHVITSRRIPISIGLFSTLLALDIFVLGVRPRNVLDWGEPFTVLGEVLVLLGLAIRTWAAGTLHKVKELTTTGPYSLVRNPLYVGSFLMMIGFGALIDDFYTVWVLIGPMLLIYWMKVRQEERYLSKKHSHAWALYRKTTPRFLPRRIVMPDARNWSFAQWRRNREYEAPLASLLAMVGLYAWHAWW